MFCFAREHSFLQTLFLSSVGLAVADSRTNRPIFTSTPGKHIKTKLAQTPRRSSSRNHPISKLSKAAAADRNAADAANANMPELSDEMRPLLKSVGHDDHAIGNAVTQTGATAANAGAGSNPHRGGRTSAADGHIAGSEADPKDKGMGQVSDRTTDQASDLSMRNKSQFGLTPLKIRRPSSISPVPRYNGQQLSGTSGDDEFHREGKGSQPSNDSFLFSPPLDHVEAPSFAKKTSTYSDLPNQDQLKVLTPTKSHRTSRVVRHLGDSGPETVSSLEARILMQLHNNIEIVADTQLQKVLPLLPAEALVLLADNENISLRTAVVKVSFCFKNHVVAILSSVI